MKILRANGDPAPFLARVAHATQSALLLDYDGTLAPFRINPAEALPYPGVQEIVARIMRSGRTRIVFVTGRAIEHFLPLLSMSPLPEVWGSHGWEHRSIDGHYECFEPLPGAAACLAQALSSAAQLESLGGRIETKPRSIAVHWRGLDSGEIAAVANRTRMFWEPLAQRANGVALHDFDGGIELRIEGRNKADAVRAVAADLGRDAPLAFFGDDRTDEDAFAALPAGGLSVLVRREFRPTGAALWLEPPDELLEFLDAWRESLLPEPAGKG